MTMCFLTTDVYLSPPGEGGKNKAFYVDVDACGYHSLSSMNTRHFTYFLEKLSVAKFECLSRHTLKVSTKQSHKIQSCLSPQYVESLCLSRPQVGVLCFMEQRKVTLRWWNIWSRLEQTSTSKTRYRVCVVQKLTASFSDLCSELVSVG